MIIRIAFAAAIFCLRVFAASPEWITVESAQAERSVVREPEKTGAGFVFSPSGARFIPWGFNYSRDDRFRLLEDYWDADGPDGWEKVDRDFREMKHLGANVVRIHLQFAKFMDAAGKPNQRSLARLSKLIELAGDLGLYLDITGLGTYRVAEVPAWYRNAPEKDHWAAQARFWEAVAQLCAGHPAVFAFNIMNEPLATSAKRPPGEWTHPAEMQGLRYVEFINLDPAGRKPPDIAKAWLDQMTQAIRKYDRRHLITVGLIWVDNAHPENGAGFPPAKIASDVDFFAVHVYPDKGKVTSLSSHWRATESASRSSSRKLSRCAARRSSLPASSSAPVASPPAGWNTIGVERRTI